MNGWVRNIVSIFAVIGIILTIIGGIIFGIERHKENNFVENICLVANAKLILQPCGKSMCYAPVWTIKYNDSIIIMSSNQVIVRITGSNSSKYAKGMNELKQHPVSNIK
ncbi:unnamed protein product [Adineta steineri]|uniref:Uncharacterized protein n=1 Tax=Adineta steineri TaxID=433720 RepID=A0A819V4Y2_9BILA|nr:unnamed protein product [Adineta steineri]